MTFYKTVETDVDLDLSVRDIYDELDSDEKEELLELLLQEHSNKSFSISNKLKALSDDEFLNDIKTWDYIIKMVKYHDSSLLEYIIEELSYSPPKI